jgi:NADH:ubiquinone oxidoreductase subunit K
MITTIHHIVLLSAFLFSVGLIIVIIKKNVIMLLLGIELLLNASNLNLIAFNQLYPTRFDGQIFTLFVMVIAVCEAAVGLAIILQGYRYFKTSVPDELNHLKD